MGLKKDRNTSNSNSYAHADHPLPTHLTMVVPFKQLGAHKASVTELYRQLLRHTTHLPARTATTRQKTLILRTVRNIFKKNKPQMSPWIVQDSLKKGYILEEKLRGLYDEDSSAKVSEIIQDMRAENPRKKRTTQPRNAHGQPMKRDLNNVQDLELQQITNYTNAYILRKQASGELPKTLDPIIRNTILRDEACHERAKKDLNRVRRMDSKGPYQVKIAYSSRVKFIRAPWKQKPVISSMILHYMRKEQTMFDMMALAEKERWLYDLEARWERLIEGDDSGWAGALNRIVKDLQKELGQKQAYFKKHAEEVLPKVLERRQRRADLYHFKVKKRLKRLEEEMKGVTPFEELLGNETLRELVKKYKFVS